MPKVELTNMVMIQDSGSGKVLVQDRKLSWKGLSFPGGHVEEGESFVDSAIREIREETGLDVADLKSCGVIHWVNTENLERYMVFLYKTSTYSGELIAEMEEGSNFWVDVKDIENYPLSPGFADYLPMFFEGKYSEFFCPWRDSYQDSHVYK